MNYLVYSSWTLVLALSTQLSSSGVQAKGLRNIEKISDLQQHRLLEDDEVGTFLIADIQYDESSRRLNGNGSGNGNGNGNRPDRTFNIETENGEIFELTNVNPAWLEGKAKGLSSGESKIKINKGASKGKGKIDLKGGMPEVVGAGHGLFDRNFNGEFSEEQHHRRAELERQLKSGNRSVLAVRVIATDEEVTFDEPTLSDEVFGTNGDPYNLVKGYEQCSYGQLTFSKAADRTGSTGVKISNGVVTIQVSNKATEGDAVLRNAATSALLAEFGVSASSLANHVMYCLPSTAMSGIAYAYVNSWNSVYKDFWCNKPSGQMHEIGHNLNFAHSSEAGTYKDQSGMMGYSYNQDDGPIMCFNAAKSYQSGWYTDGTTTITPILETDNCFEGKIYGIVDYEYQIANRNVLIKIDASSGDSYFVNFNRKTGFNSGTVEGGDQVMVVSVSGEGNTYKESELRAKLSSGGAFIITNFGGSGLGVTVEVLNIDLFSSPPFAEVRISRPGSTCDTATSSPTTRPTPNPTKVPTTPPTNAPSAPPTPSPTSSPTTSSAPSATPTTSQPTTSPTKKPTLSPTAPPTPKPTSSPTKKPTQGPTVTPNCSDLGQGQCNIFSRCEWIVAQGSGSCKDLTICEAGSGSCNNNAQCCSGNCKGNGTCKPL